jgi:PIN domain nuclease of toxin-antitoxin system
MKLLLDTHVLLWALASPERLSDSVRAAIANPSHAVLVSAASAWEVEIKASLGKLQVPSDLDRQLVDRGFLELPVRVRHTRALRDLPALHRDPFDRLLVAQAIVEDLVLVTADEALVAYPARTMRA